QISGRFLPGHPYGAGPVKVVGYSIELRELPGGVSVLRLTGDADLYAAPELRERLLGAVRAGRKRWICDLSDIDFIDSTAFGILVQARKLGATFHVVCPDPTIAGTFAIVGLDRVLPLHETLAEASAAVEDVEAGVAAPDAPAFGQFKPRRRGLFRALRAASRVRPSADA
ncbi:MAG TPA: STAS domain-containing protein, partial [Thermoleophilaceae bacterium]|nr:STAS domain-containing protein [Thermoleophilaceae bacterium]